jgi:hypothetical protein
VKAYGHDYYVCRVDSAALHDDRNRGDVRNRTCHQLDLCALEHPIPVVIPQHAFAVGRVGRDHLRQQLLVGCTPPERFDPHRRSLASAASLTAHAAAVASRWRCSLSGQLPVVPYFLLQILRHRFEKLQAPWMCGATSSKICSSPLDCDRTISIGAISASASAALRVASLRTAASNMLLIAVCPRSRGPLHSRPDFDQRILRVALTAYCREGHPSGNRNGEASARASRSASFRPHALPRACRAAGPDPR